MDAVNDGFDSPGHNATMGLSPETYPWWDIGPFQAYQAVLTGSLEDEQCTMSLCQWLASRLFMHPLIHTSLRA